MTFQRGQQTYAQGVGVYNTATVHLDTRNPTSNDTNYEVGFFWQNTSGGSLWYLNSKSTITGTLQANWYQISQGAAEPIDELVGNSGSALPASGIVNVLGSGELTTTGSGDTLTIAATGDLLALSALSTTGIAVRTATSTWTTRTITEGTGIDIVNGDGVSGNPTITFDVTEVPAIPTSFTTDSGTATPALNVLTVTGGLGCTTSGSGSTITVDVVGSGLTWNNTTGTSAVGATNNGYICSNAGATTVSLPATAAFGDSFAIINLSGTSTTITQAANQQIRVGTSTTTVGAGGSLAASDSGSSIELICTTANLVWAAFTGTTGNWVAT